MVITPANNSDAAQAKAARGIYEQCLSRGIDALLDDRDERPGVKFKDADLIGVPLRVVIGERGLKQGQLELKWRWESAPEMIPMEDAAGRIAELVRQERVTGERFRKKPPG